MSDLAQVAYDTAMAYLKANPKIVVYDLADACAKAGAAWQREEHDKWCPELCERVVDLKAQLAKQDGKECADCKRIGYWCPAHHKEGVGSNQENSPSAATVKAIGDEVDRLLPNRPHSVEAYCPNPGCSCSDLVIVAGEAEECPECGNPLEPTDSHQENSSGGSL